jgi:two-component system invasion response regulator UvrY
MSRILIADDHAVARAGYRLFLDGNPLVSMVGEAGRGRETLAALRRQGWDLLMMDINMPDRNGLDLLEHARVAYPDTPVLIVSGLPEEQYARNVLRAGASGYLSKSSAADELLKAVHLILQGRRYVSPALAEAMAEDVNSNLDLTVATHDHLTSREFQILCKLAAGARTKLIASELHLSTKTVSAYRRRILMKMGFTYNADITAYAFRNGLLT